MAKTLKWIAIVVVALVVVVAGGAWLATKLVNPAQVKAAISRIAAERTHGKLDIGGTLAWAFFPQIALTAGDVTYTRNGRSEPMAKIGLLKLGVDFWPLLHGQVNVGQVTLSGLKLDLVRDKAGHGNWENLLVERPQQAPAQPAPSAGPLALAVAGVDIDHTSIRYTDLAAGTRQSLDDVAVSSRSVNVDGKPFPLSFSFTAKSSDPALTAHIDAKGTAAVDGSNRKADLTDAAITVAANGAPTNGKTVTARLTFSAHADLAANRAEIPAVELTVDDLDASGRFTATGLDTSPAITGSVKIKPFNPRKLAAAIGVELPKLTDPKALTNAGLSADVKYGDQAVSAGNLLLTLDDSTVKGTVALRSGDKRRAILAVFDIDQLDLDRYRTAPAEAAKEQDSGKPSATPAVPAGTPLIPLPLVRGVDSAISVKVGKLTAAKLPFEKTVLQIQSKNDVVHLNKFDANLFGAPLNASGQLDVSGNVPRLTAAAHVDKLPLKRVLKTVKQIDWLEGALTLSANVKSSGNSTDALMRKLDGTVTFDVAKPVLRGMNLERTACQAIALTNREQLTAQWGPDTQMNAIKGDIVITNGIADNKSLTGGLANMDLKGHGTINPIDSTLDYHLGIRVSGAEAQKDHACRIPESQQNIYWPLRCHGSFDTRPSKLCGIDSDALNKILATKATEEIQRKAGKKLEDALQKWMK